MIKVTYRERKSIGLYTCYDTTKTLNAISYFQPEGVSLIYFKINPFDYRVIPKEDIIEIEE